MRYETSVLIDAPSSQVWAVVADVTDWPRWTPSITSVTRGEAGDLMMGSTARIKQPGFPPAVWRVTELEPGAFFSWISRGPGAVTTGGHRVLVAEAGSTLELTLQMRGPAGGLIGLLLGRRFRRWVDLEADGLRRAAESMSGR